MAALEEKLAEAERQIPVLYEKSCRDFKDNSKKRLAWDNVVKQVGLHSFICLMCSSVRIMLECVRWAQNSDYNLLLPWFRCRRLLRRMRIKSNGKSSNLSSSPESAILNVHK